jgi:hypothetical protein
MARPMTRLPQNSVDDKHKPNQREELGYNGCGVRLRDRYALPDTELTQGQLGICVSPQPLLPLTPRDTSNGSPHDTRSTEFG